MNISIGDAKLLCNLLSQVMVKMDTIHVRGEADCLAIGESIRGVRAVCNYINHAIEQAESAKDAGDAV